MIENHKVSSLEGPDLEKAISSDFNLPIKNPEKVLKGYSSQVYKASLGEEVVYIRINKDPRIFQVEELGYKIFEEKGIPVPKIIAYQENPPTIKLPTMIMQSAKGKSIKESESSIEEKDIIYEKIGKIVHDINSVKLEGFGPLSVVGGELVGQFKTAQEYMMDRSNHNYKALDYCVNNGFINSNEEKIIRKIYEEINYLEYGKASLIHRDIHQGHFFVDGSNVTGIIDLGSLTASDPRYDVAMSMVFQDNHEQECFKRGYGDLANDKMVNKYMIMILVAKIYFRSKVEIKGNVDVLTPKLKEELSKI